MSNPNIKHPTVLVAIDYSDSSTSVVDEAVAIAQRYRACDLHFVHVNQLSPEDEEGQLGTQLELTEWLGARLPDADGALDGISVVAHEVSGDPWRVIVQLAHELGADVVVVGTHGRRGLERVMLGSVAEAVSRHCGCSVLVVRKKTHAQAGLQLEPLCGLCVEARLESQGNVLWCHDHVARKDRRHTYHGPGIGRWLRQTLGA